MPISWQQIEQNKANIRSIISSPSNIEIKRYKVPQYLPKNKTDESLPVQSVKLPTIKNGKITVHSKEALSLLHEKSTVVLPPLQNITTKTVKPTKMKPIPKLPSININTFTQSRRNSIDELDMKLKIIKMTSTSQKDQFKIHEILEENDDKNKRVKDRRRRKNQNKLDRVQKEIQDRIKSMGWSEQVLVNKMDTFLDVLKQHPNSLFLGTAGLYDKYTLH